MKVSRDKRGYEQISLMHASTRRGKPSKPQVLYVFRTPPGVKLGREPFDESIRREIETQHPDVHFDWVKLSKIPVPSPDVEYWRERRRAEKAAKQARREAEREEAPAEAQEMADDSPPLPESSALDPEAAWVALEEPAIEIAALEALEPEDAEELPGVEDAAPEHGQVPSAEAATTLPPGVDSGEQAPSGRRRRRRRGGRRRHKRTASAAAAAEPDATQSLSGSEEVSSPEPSSGPSKVPEDPSKKA